MGIILLLCQLPWSKGVHLQINNVSKRWEVYLVYLVHLVYFGYPFCLVVWSIESISCWANQHMGLVALFSVSLNLRFTDSQMVYLVWAVRGVVSVRSGNGDFVSLWSYCKYPERFPQYPHKSFLNSSKVRPASLIIPPIVNASTGFALGMVIILSPLVITICLPCLSIQNPRFSKAFTALWWLIPGSLGIRYFHVSDFFVSCEFIDNL